MSWRRGKTRSLLSVISFVDWIGLAYVIMIQSLRLISTCSFQGICRLKAWKCLLMALDTLKAPRLPFEYESSVVASWSSSRIPDNEKACSRKRPLRHQGHHPPPHRPVFGDIRVIQHEASRGQPCVSSHAMRPSCHKRRPCQYDPHQQRQSSIHPLIYRARKL
jgi:hypothetical protein